MLPHFLRHYDFADRIFLYDNGSDDATTSIAQRDPRVTLQRFDSNNRFNEQIHVNLKNSIWHQSRGKADWVIVCDVDELLYHPNIKQALQQMQQQQATILKPRGFEMVGSKTPNPDVNLLQMIPNGVRSYSFDKCVLFNPNAIQNINYGVGAHVCQPTGTVRYHRTANWKLLHYKHLSIDYLLLRYQQLAQRLSDFNKQHQFATNYLHSELTTRHRYQQLLQQYRPVVIDEEDHCADAATTALWRKQAMQLLQQQQFNAAAELLQRILLSSADDTMALANMGLILQRQRRFSDAQMVMQQALAIDNNNYQIWFNFGNLLLRNQRYDQAKECYQQVLQHKPDFVMAQQRIAECQQHID